jgi:hypothetical protein
MSYSIDTTNSLLALAEVKTFLDIDNTDFDDQISRLIDVVSWFFNNETKRELKNREQTEYYDGDGSQTLYTKNWPITDSASELSLYINASVPRSFTSSEQVDSDYIMVDGDNGRIDIWNDTFTKGRRTVKLVYNAGYSTIPDDLHRAALETLGSLWKKEQSQVWNMNNISIEGASVSLQMDKIMSAWARHVIHMYERKVL